MKSIMFNREEIHTSAMSLKGQAFILDYLKNNGNKLNDVYENPSAFKVKEFNKIIEELPAELANIDPDNVFVIRHCKASFTVAFVDTWYSRIDGKRKGSRLYVLTKSKCYIIPFTERDVLAAISNEYGPQLLDRSMGFMSDSDYQDFCRSIGVTTYTCDVIIDQYNRTARGEM